MFIHNIEVQRKTALAAVIEAARKKGVPFDFIGRSRIYLNGREVGGITYDNGGDWGPVEVSGAGWLEGHGHVVTWRSKMGELPDPGFGPV